MKGFQWVYASWVVLGMGLAMALTRGETASGVESHSLNATERGATVRTDRYEVEIRDGAIVRLFNALTREEYGSIRPDPLWRHQLPGGLATQNGPGAREAAAMLHTWPWSDHALLYHRPNQHIPDAQSAMSFERPDDRTVVLTYRDLTDGKNRYPDEVYRLRIEVEEETGDLLITPSAESPRPGVYGVCLQIGRLRPAVSVEAPIWDGMRITSDMPDCLWHNQWPSFWDFQFLALNGQEQGAFGLWAQDGRFDYYKSLFFMVRDGTISLSLESFATPPFDTLRSVTSVTWRLQAFDRHWTQAAARYRAWRDGPNGIAISKRPDYALRISAVTQLIWADDPTRRLITDVWGEYSDRFAVWFPTVRRQPFDENHWDNTPYEKFKPGMQEWNAKGGPPTIAYLQPMIMWGAQNAKTEEALQIVKWSREATTISPFRDGKPHWHMDQHHLGHPAWQRWFLDVVKDWIQNHGTRGIYHDQSYICPIDSRGLINGMNSVQGMADYFRKVNEENPGSIHATEHLQEANLVGCSLGIGPLTLWGTEPVMRQQRIRHASPVSAALQYPHAATWNFTHDREGNGTATLVNWQITMAENRGHLPYDRNPRKPGDAAEALVDAVRLETFVRLGLRPFFPEEWDPNVRTYFRGAKGEDVRYEKLGPREGSQFVQILPDGTRKVLYSRIHGVRNAEVPGAIHGWVCYTTNGPSGLNPDRYYVVDPEASRPSAWLEPYFRTLPELDVLPHPYAAYIEDGGANDHILWAKIRSLYPRKAGPRTGEVFLLHAAEKPVAVYVDGKAVNPNPGPEAGTWKIDTAQDSDLFILLKTPTGRDPDKTTVLARHVNEFGCDRTVPSVMAQQIAVKTGQIKTPDGLDATIQTITVPFAGHYSFARTQFHAPFRGTAERPETLEILAIPAHCEVWVDGKRVLPVNGMVRVEFKGDETRLVSILRTYDGEVHESWGELPVRWRWTVPTGVTSIPTGS